MKKLSRHLWPPFNRAYAEPQLREFHARPPSLEETVDWVMNFGGGSFITIKTLRRPPEITRLAPPGSPCAVTLLSCDAHSPAFKQRMAEALAGEKADFLFTDGDYTAEYLDYRKFARPGSLIAFHDIVENQPLSTNQVFRLWTRLKQVAEYEEIVEDPRQCGFGIIRVPEGGAPGLPG